MSIKKRSTHAFVFIVLCATSGKMITSSPAIFGNIHRFVERFDDEQDQHAQPMPDDFIEGLNELENLVDSVPIGQDNSMRVLSPETIVELLQEVSFITALKEEELFRHTNILNSRSLLDLPLFEPNRCCYCHDLIVGAHLFYNHTQRSRFTNKSTDIGSYFALAQDSLIDKLEDSIDAIKDLFANPAFNLDIRKLAKTFSKMTVQERRAGLMLHAGHMGKRSEIRIMWPFYYRERNFFLRNSERKIIEEELGALDPEEQKKLEKEHFISDKLGFGDIRVEAAFRVYWNERSTVRVGWLATIPAAFPIKRGLMGSCFPKSSCPPLFDFDRLFDLACMDPLNNPAVQEEAFDMVRNFFLGALDRVAAQLLDVNLGNDSHPGLGFLLRNTTRLGAIIKKPWAQSLVFRTRGSFEYLFAANEHRMYIKRDNPGAFRFHDFNDPSMATENLTFLEQQFVDKFYLIGLDSKVRPGCIFRWTSKFCYEGPAWGAYIGGEWWVQGRESIKHIEAPPSILATIDFAKARIPFPYQNRVFAGVSYKIERDDYSVYLSFNADGTTIKSGIGSDYTLSINVEANF